MLERTDRMVLAIRDADAVAEGFHRIFETRVAGDEKDALLGARRLTLSFGRDQVELVEPRGPGPVADFLAAGRSGAFAGGFALGDPSAAAARLERAGVRVHPQGPDRYVVLPADLHGTGVILSSPATSEPVGLCDKIWQISYAMPRLREAVDRYTDLFGLGDRFTNFYDSELYGYTGAITWFDARDRAPLDSLEYLEPIDHEKAVGRFVARNGTGIYMASIESNEIPEIQRRVQASGTGWQGTDFGGFIHPKRLGGLLLGLVGFERWNARRPLPGRPEHG
jgi:hypothetical protein